MNLDIIILKVRQSVMIYALVISLIYALVPVVSHTDSPWTCVQTNTSNSSQFCSDVKIAPLLCTSDNIFDDNQRSAKGFTKQKLQCKTKGSRKKVCPNDPTKCKYDVFNQTTYCGGNGQTCSTDDNCLSYCYDDCYPCNTRENCDLLVSFGIAAPPNAPCFSLEGGYLAHSKVLQIIRDNST